MKPNTSMRIATFAGTILTSALVTSLMPPVAAMISGTVILTAGLTIDDRISRGPFKSGEALRRRITTNLVMCGIAALIMTALTGLPGRH